MAYLYTLRPLDIAIIFLSVIILSRLLRNHRRLKTTPLNGPPNKGFLFGHAKAMVRDHTGTLLEQWMEEYGSTFSVSQEILAKRVIITDPKSVASFYSKETFVYQGMFRTKRFIGLMFGKGLLWSEGESHRRQRKALSPAFSNVAIRRLTSIFYDSSYKLKAAWDQIILATPNEAPIFDVQIWMNRVALDSIGIAGFSHDFKGLTDPDHPSPVAIAFDSFGSSAPTTLFSLSVLLGVFCPPLAGLTNFTKRGKILMGLGTMVSVVAEQMLDKEKSGGGNSEEDKSIIGLLIKASNTDSNKSLHITQEEVKAQMNVLLLAGYETTSTSLTWALIELCHQPALQDQLRSELLQHGADPTWDQFTNDLPYLDAVVHETLRLHPAQLLTTRVATEDDTLPLTAPIITATGETVDQLFIAKGTTISVPIHLMNKSPLFWGSDAKEFNPKRWLVDDGGLRKNDISGHRHLLTFIDGPRTCLGNGFALAELKSVLSVLIRNYTFELPDGVDTPVEIHRSIVPRPKLAGQAGPQVPLRVRKVD